MEKRISKTMKVLLVEDSQAIAQQIRLFLQGDGALVFTITHSTELARALELVGTEEFDVILLDLGLPDSSGLETFTRVNEKAPHIPTVVFTGTDDEHLAMEALRTGAQDYLVKGYVDGKLLRRAISYSIERKKLLTELHKSKEELAQKTAQLIESEKMNALNELTAGVAHELNQPLNAIKITCEDVLSDLRGDKLDNGQLEECLADVIKEVKKMAEVISHMRIFARWSHSRALVEIESASPVDGALKIIGEQLKENGIEVITEIDPSLVFMGDAARFQQVILNLIFNARDAVMMNPEQKDKKIVIKNRLEKSDKSEKTHLVYEIADNGAGMSKAVQEKIFQPFFVGNGPGRGTGLGLSVARQIVKEHKGTIEVESTEGEGSTFRIFLPLAN